MNSNPHNPSVPAAVSGTISSSAEQTLRLIASLPAPAGLEDRVHAALGAAARSGRILAWPQSDWMRTAAAAAIVFVVAGGGWGVYTHVQHGQPAKVIVLPRAMQQGGFSGAGAKRTPQTLPGPTVTLPVKPTPSKHKAMKKPAAGPTVAPAASAGAASTATVTAKPDASK